MKPTVKDLLIGKKVRMIEDCGELKKGYIEKIKFNSEGALCVGFFDCFHASHWELLEPLEYKPAPHIHEWECSCGHKLNNCLDNNPYCPCHKK